MLWCMDEPTGTCALCGATFVEGRRKKLNSLPVCVPCSNSYQNRRVAAFLVDLALLSALGCLPSVWKPLFPVSDLVGPFLFLGLFFRDGFWGFSPGKWLLDLRVVGYTTHEPTGFFRSVLRNLPLLLSWIGVLVIIPDLRRGRRWGDGLAGTIVIWRRYAQSRAFWPPGPNCLKCLYDLTGNVSGICPECGTPVPVHLRQPSRPAEVDLDVRSLSN